MTKKLFIAGLLLLSLDLYAQKQGVALIDSLLSLLKTDKADTNKVNHYNALAWEYSTRNPDTALKYSSVALVLSQQIHWLKGVGAAYHQGGWAHYNKGAFVPAIAFYQQALHIWDSLLSDNNSVQKLTINIKKASTLGNLGLVYSEKADYPRALDYYFKALKLDEGSANKNGIARHNGNIGFVFWSQGEYTKAMDYYFRALTITRELNNKNATAGHLGRIGLVYWTQGNYPQALDYFFNALKIDEELDNKRGVARHLGNIGNVYLEQQDFQKALDYYFRALKIAVETGDTNGEALHLGNIGGVYRQQGDHDKALEYNFKALKIDEQLGKDAGVARHYRNIGSDFSDKKDYPAALSYFLKSLTIEEKLNNKKGIAISQGNIGWLYAETKDYGNAEKYLLRSVALTREIGELYYEKLYREKLGSLYEHKGNPAKALEQFKTAAVLKDSLFNLEKNKEITRKEMNYEFEKKEALNKAEQEKKDALAKVQIQKQKLFRNYLIIIFLLILLISYILFSRFQLKKKLEKQQAIIDERRRISSDMHDDLGSNLSRISLVSEVLKKHVTDSQDREEIQKISSSAQGALEKMSEIVWALNPHNDKLGNLLAYIRKYAVEYFEPTAIECKIKMPEQIADVELNGEQRRNIFLIVKESLHNVVKHAGATMVNITFSGDKGNWELVIHDNGKGIDPGLQGKRKDGSSGNGLESMKQRMEQIKGKFTIGNSDGTLIRLEFPAE